MKIKMIIFTCIYIFSSFELLAETFEFYSASERKLYTSNEFSSQLSEEYGRKINVNILLIASKNCSCKFKEQVKELDTLDAETLKLVYVFACSSQTIRDSYHTKEKVTKKVLNGKKFRVLIISSAGDVLLESIEKVNSLMILKALNK